MKADNWLTGGCPGELMVNAIHMPYRRSSGRIDGGTSSYMACGWHLVDVIGCHTPTSSPYVCPALKKHIRCPVNGKLLRSHL